MRVVNMSVAVVFAVATGSALAETGVNVGDIGFVSNVYGRGGTPAVQTVEPLMTWPANVNFAGRNPVRGVSEVLVKVEGADVNSVEGRG